LAKEIIAYTGGPDKCKYLHLTRRNSQYLWYYASLKKAHQWQKQGYSVVIDRNWTSECIYGKIYRPNERPEYDFLVRMIHRMSLSLGVLNILCIPSQWDKDRYEKLCHDREEMYHDKMEEVYAAYRKLYFGQGFENWSPPSSYIDQLSKSGVSARPDFMRYDMNNNGKDVIKNIVSRALDLKYDQTLRLQYSGLLKTSLINTRGYIFLGNPRTGFNPSGWPLVSLKCESREPSVIFTKSIHEIGTLENNVHGGICRKQERPNFRNHRFTDKNINEISCHHQQSKSPWL
jgi:hypothetical protein